MDEDRYQKMLYQTEEELDSASISELVAAERQAAERCKYSAAAFFRRVRLHRVEQEKH